MGVLRGYSRFCIQESLLVVLRVSNGVPEIEPRFACKVAYRLAIYIIIYI